MVRKSSSGIRSWQLFVLAIVVAGVGALIISIAFAGRKVSPVVDADYYARGLSYNRDTARQRSGERLGWRMETAMAGDALVVRVTDGTGMPVRGGRITVALMGAGGGPAQTSAAAAGTQTLFNERSPGVYQTALPHYQGASTKATVTFSRGDAELASSVVVFR